MRYVYRPGDPAANENGMVAKEIATPKGIEIIRDIEPYQSPIDGRVIGSRREKREDLKRSGCVEYERPSHAPQGLTNLRFAKKHNAIDRLTPEARERYEESRKRGEI